MNDRSESILRGEFKDGDTIDVQVWKKSSFGGLLQHPQGLRVRTPPVVGPQHGNDRPPGDKLHEPQTR